MEYDVNFIYTTQILLRWSPTKHSGFILVSSSTLVLHLEVFPEFVGDDTEPLGANYRDSIGCRGRTRTLDFQIMGLTSYQLLYPAIYK